MCLLFQKNKFRIYKIKLPSVNKIWEQGFSYIHRIRDLGVKWVQINLLPLRKSPSTYPFLRGKKNYLPLKFQM